MKTEWKRVPPLRIRLTKKQRQLAREWVRALDLYQAVGGCDDFETATVQHLLDRWYFRMNQCEDVLTRELGRRAAEAAFDQEFREVGWRVDGAW